MEIAATFNPVTYVMEAMRSLILDDLDWATIWPGFAVVVVFAAADGAAQRPDDGTLRLILRGTGVPPGGFRPFGAWFFDIKRLTLGEMTERSLSEMPGGAPPDAADPVAARVREIAGGASGRARAADRDPARRPARVRLPAGRRLSRWWPTSSTSASPRFTGSVVLRRLPHRPAGRPSPWRSVAARHVRPSVPRRWSRTPPPPSAAELGEQTPDGTVGLRADLLLRQLRARAHRDGRRSPARSHGRRDARCARRRRPQPPLETRRDRHRLRPPRLLRPRRRRRRGGGRAHRRGRPPR